MPRPLRIEYEGAWYHVMNRGNNYQNIFLSAQHNELFLKLLEEISIKFNVEIHSYCLMNNHYHLLLHTPLANLGRAMRHLDGIYTQKFNRSEGKDGSLFRGRYKSILVESEAYLLQLSRYIHLNPVPSICRNPVEYPWSSLQFYAKEKTNPSWLKTDVILSYVNNLPTSYLKFINEGIDDEIKMFYEKKSLPSILGSEKFINDHLSKIKNAYKIPYSPDINRTKPKLSIEDIFEEVMNYFQIDKKEIVKITPGKTNYFKLITIYLASQMGQLSHSKICNYFEVSNESIGASLKRYRVLMIECKRTQEDLNNIIQKLW